MSTIKQGLSEFVSARHDMEQRLRAFISAEISAFHDLTGTTVQAVDVHIHTLPRLGLPADRFVSSVKVTTPLD